MKHTSIIAALAAFSLLTIGGPSIAQQSSNQDSATSSAASDVAAEQNQAIRLATLLKLTDDQTSKWVEIVQDSTQQGLAVRQNDSLSPDQKAAQITAIRKSALAQLRVILTPAQQKTLDELLAINAQRQAGAGKSNSFADVVGRLVPALKLTVEQSARWDSIEKDSRQKGLALLQNDSLTFDQKHAKDQALHKSELTQLRAILSPLQQRTFDQVVNNA